MLFFDVFDSLGTIVGVMANAGLIRKNGRIPYMQRIMLSDALDTIAGACLGCTTVTTYVESATGVAEGGRSGLSALVIALCFMLSLFLAPLFLAIPAVATAPVMVMAGFYLFGIGVRESPEKAFEMLKRASDEGLPEASKQIAWMYGVGHGVEKSETESFKWTLKAAEQGDARA